MSWVGLPLTRTRSARIPGAILPRSERRKAVAFAEVAEIKRLQGAKSGFYQILQFAMEGRVRRSSRIPRIGSSQNRNMRSREWENRVHCDHTFPFPTVIDITLQLFGVSRQPLSPAWLQAHGQAQVFGWVGSFILGIDFYSLTKMQSTRTFPVLRG